MTIDSQYDDLRYEPSEIDHAYGENVHIQKDGMALSLLARLCSPEVGQPTFNRLLTRLYQRLLWNVVNAEFPRTQASIPSRMNEGNDEGVYRGEIIDPGTRVVTVDVARAGMVPSNVCFEQLTDLLEPRAVRQDHLFMSRQTDEQGNVTGAKLSGEKVGESVEGRIVLFPDPMGATGYSLSQALDFYRRQVGGEADKLVTMNAIVTPEFVRRISEEHPEVVCYALRLDRGMSPEEVKALRPGERWEEESGLNEEDYIIPGGGGFGELMNNAWV
jgi:uracil phosphoribosyltransferase